MYSTTFDKSKSLKILVPVKLGFVTFIFYHCVFNFFYLAFYNETKFLSF